MSRFDTEVFSSIAASLEKIANPLITINVPHSESEKFFAHLNNGEVSFKRFGHWPDDENLSWSDDGYRVVITPKEVGE